jgi:hypothetical protein
MKHKTQKHYSDQAWMVARIVIFGSIIAAFILWILLHHYTDHIWACRQSAGGIIAAAAVAYLIGKTSKKIFFFLRKVLHAVRAINKLQNQTNK